MKSVVDFPAKVTLLGGSNSVKRKGLQAGLNKYANVANYALGASTSLQNLYEIIRNQSHINQSSLVITESNVNDFHCLNLIDGNIEVIKSNICLLYYSLSKLECPVLVILLPLMSKGMSGAEEINRIHLECINQYGFNYIDMHQFYLDHKIDTLLEFDNLDHPNETVMRKLGEVIGERIKDFARHRLVNDNTQLDLKVFTDFGSKKFFDIRKNSVFCETVFRLDKKKNFDSQMNGYQVLGFHTWSKYNAMLCFENESVTIGKLVNTECQFHDLQKEFVINDNAFISSEYFPPTEKSFRTRGLKINSDKLDIVSIFLKKGDLPVEGSPNTAIVRNDLLEYLVDFKLFIEDYNKDRKDYLYRNSFPYKFKKMLKDFLIEIRQIRSTLIYKLKS